MVAACWPQPAAQHTAFSSRGSSGGADLVGRTHAGRARCCSISTSSRQQHQQHTQHIQLRSMPAISNLQAAAAHPSSSQRVRRSVVSCSCSQQPYHLRPLQQKRQQLGSLLQPSVLLGSSSGSSRGSQHHQQQLQQRQQRLAHLVARAGSQSPDPWSSPSGRTNGGSSRSSGGSGSGAGAPPPPPPPPPPAPPLGGNGSASPTASYDPWDAAGEQPPPSSSSSSKGSMPRYEQTDWGWTGVPEDWDPAEGLNSQQLLDMQRDYLETLQRRRASQDPPRDKWITPLLDWQSISGAFDPDQSRTEDAMADEALTNKEESREALSFVGRLVVIPLITGALISRAITDPVLSFSLQNNPDAFALSGHQKLEGAQALHMEETRVKMMMAIGQIPPLDEGGMLEHLHEFALEFQEEEREKNEASLMTLVSDSISAMVFFIMFVRDNDAREALFSTIGRLFEGLSDIAKAVMIILVADTLLGYHSEEGWTGFLDLFLGHYGIEVEEENIVLFVGIIPIAIDVLFKYWIFIGLNKISPGAVVTIKQLDRH